MTLPPPGRARTGGSPVGGRRLIVVSHTGLMSGAETVLLRLVRSAADGGWSVRCLTPPGPFERRMLDLGIETETIPELKLPALPRVLAAGVALGRGLRAARHLRRASAGADLILLNGILALPALRFARVRTPSVWLVHDVVRRRDWRALLRSCGPAADLAVAVSEAVAVPLRDAGLPVVVIRNGTTWPVSPAPTQHAEPFVVGCAALLTPWKGQRVLLDAVAELARDDVVVELAGGRFPKDQAYAAELERRASDRDLEGRVRFLGHVSDMTEQTRRWSVAVVASVEPEAGPLGLLEHMSIGLPIVATDHGGSPEVLGDAGVLVPPGDPGAMASALATLLDDHQLRRRCAEAGPRQIAAGLTLAEQQNRFLALLERLASDGARTTGE